MAKRRVYAMEFPEGSDADRVAVMQEVEELLRAKGVKFEMSSGTFEAVMELSRSAGAPDYGPGYGQTVKLAKLPPHKWGDDGAWRDRGDVFVADNVAGDALVTALKAAGFTVHAEWQTREMSRSAGGTTATADPGEAAYREGDEWRRAELSRRGLPADPLQAEVDKNLAQTGLGQKALDARAKDRGAYQNAHLSYHR